MIRPVDLLKVELHKYKKALEKSKASLDKDEIPLIVHLDHKANLEPIIQEYTDAIYTLQIYGK
jgi:fructose/tagatose bisphosphate aldolase